MRAMNSKLLLVIEGVLNGLSHSIFFEAKELIFLIYTSLLVLIPLLGN